MIQAITESSFTAYINTEANRIDTSVASTQIRHLMKFTNDLDGAEFYAYARVETINNRYTYLELPVFPQNGVVQGLVAIGKLNLSELSGTEQVQYTQRQEPSGTNYIWYGQ